LYHAHEPVALAHDVSHAPWQVGTVRFNLDPFEGSTEDELWTALRRANMTDHVTDLDMEVAEGGR
jgi:ABC-type multidrug transport system fused ATPase/permease subunit